jgi:hypothetical protein
MVYSQVIIFVTILELVTSLSVPKEATAEMVKPEVKQHFEAAAPKAVEMLPNHEMKRSLDHTEGPRSERCELMEICTQEKKERKKLFTSALSGKSKFFAETLFGERFSKSNRKVQQKF